MIHHQGKIPSVLTSYNQLFNKMNVNLFCLLNFVVFSYSLEDFLETEKP